jgi:uncharacterized membrane protein YozB (DUF420 family)
MDIRDLPTLNAGLNGAATILLLAGYRLIRGGRREAHKRAMLAAFLASTAFLASYLVYHYHVGSVRYEGPLRSFYLAVLVTHVILAATIPVLAIMTLYRAWKGNFASHKAIARVTLPIWLYVGVTGVLVYLMLYRL